ncbi:hypothetical protein BGZ94_009489 [Podila epigama]|nr:hypothetical protein BGZ94_009489 [Podila epigama]
MILLRRPNISENYPTPAESVSLHEKNRAIWDKANSYEQPVISRTDNYNMRTEYVPEIRILKRPKSPVVAVRVASTPSKPLEQRQADYNAAREKIFGVQQDTTTPSTSTSSSTTTTSTDSTGLNRSLSSLSLSSSQGAESGSTLPVKPIEFRGPPPKIRPAYRGTSAANGGSNTQDKIVRQPRGPSMNAPSSHNGNNSQRLQSASRPLAHESTRNGTNGPRRGGGGSANSQQQQQGSIGFHRPFKGVRPPPSTQSSSPSSPKQ